MNLVIQAHTYKNEPLPKPLIARFDALGGTIGRMDTNTLALPDPERHISRLHAEVWVTNGLFSIRNVGSANPIVINGRLIAPGASAPLSASDEIVMGSYVMRVIADQAAGSDREAQLVRPAAPERRVEEPPQAQPSAHQGLDSTVPAELEPPTPAKPSRTQISAFANLLQQAAPQPTQVSDDAWSTGAANLAAQPDLALPSTPLKPWYKFGAATAAPVPAKPKLAAVPAVPQRADTSAVHGIMRSSHQMPEVTTPAVRVASRELPFTVAPPKPMPPIPGPSKASALTAPDAPPKAQASSSSDALWAAFCEGAGSTLELPHGLNADTMRTLGKVLHQLTQGTLKLVAARSAAKQELHAQVTTIQARNNNPLKCSPDAASALMHLLQAPTRGSMSGTAAITEIMDDLQGHTVGTMAGMKSALSDIVNQFDPCVLEAKLSQHSSIMNSLLPTNRRAKLWELYVQHFEQIKADTEGDFHELFGPTFLHAYDEQLKQLNKDRLHTP